MSDPTAGAPGSSPTEEKQRAAEREVRHGNFRGALALFQELARQDPGNAHYAARIATLEEGLQPMELVHPKAAAGAAAQPMTSDLQEGEAAANIGDFATAVNHYERVVAADPENELATDRLEELRGLLAASATAPKPGLGEAEAAPAPVPELGIVERVREDPPAVAAADPGDPVELLELLRERIRERRRP